MLTIKKLDSVTSNKRTVDITIAEANAIQNWEYAEKGTQTDEDLKQFFAIPKTQQIGGNEKSRKASSAEEPHTFIAAVKAAVEKAQSKFQEPDALDPANLNSELSFDAGGPKSLLEMVYDIAEIATAKYDYNMRGDDFKFTMSVVHYSFKSLAEVTQGSAFELTSNRISAGIENILGANKYRRLEELRESIQQHEFEGRPQAAYIQSIFLAQLYVIRDEMQKQLDVPLSTTAEAALRTSLAAQYRIILAGLNERELSPSFNAAAQGVLLEMRNLVEGE
jgi:hypothetical protein